jgi:hypothetical protein
MSDESNKGVSISVGGSNYGALWAGDRNTVVVNAKTGATTTLTPDEVRSVADSIDQLRDRIASEVPPGQRDAALSQVAQLQSAILPQPKVGRMQEVRDWFVKHLPSMLGTLTTIFVNPIVGKIVQAAGEMTASAFHNRFG